MIDMLIIYIYIYIVLIQIDCVDEIISPELH